MRNLVITQTEWDVTCITRCLATKSMNNSVTNGTKLYIVICMSDLKPAHAKKAFYTLTEIHVE